jgi:succinate-semialdehyde dehydrogenase/glutarate-semialdehyde dehydrogenase
MKRINPATETVLEEMADHSPEEIEKILATASARFDSWKTVSLHQRARLLKEVAVFLRKELATLAGTITREMGKPIVDAEAEIEKCAGCCDFFAENAFQFLAPQTILSDAQHSYVRFDPLGPVLAIMPWNFPFWQVFRFAAPAIVAGNVGILKHAPNVPECALAIERAFMGAGFPPGVFSSILLSDNAAAEKLVAHPAIKAVTLTGSERAGSAVASLAGKSLKKTVMELGGSDPFIVLKDVDVDAVAKFAAQARCINAGQSCIAAKRFIVDQSILEPFQQAMAAAMNAMIVGDPANRGTQIGPLARLDLLENLDRQVQQSLEQGARIVCGGKRAPGRGFFYRPTLLTNITPGMAAFDEETFGPVGAIISARDPDDALRLANLSSYGLGSSIWTQDTKLAEELAAKIEAGNVFINAMVKSDPHLPFGGIKNSGWGRELSSFGIREFVNIKTVWMGK